MLEILRKVIAFLGTITDLIPNIPLEKIVEIIQKFLDLGTIPDVDQEQEMRAWMLKLLATLKEVAELTGTGYDDMVIKFLDKAVNDQGSWDLMYAVLKMVFRDRDDKLVEADDSMVKLSDETGLNPIQIITIAKMIYDLYKWWKNR